MYTYSLFYKKWMWAIYCCTVAWMFTIYKVVQPSWLQVGLGGVFVQEKKLFWSRSYASFILFHLISSYFPATEMTYIYIYIYKICSMMIFHLIQLRFFMLPLSKGDSFVGGPWSPCRQVYGVDWNLNEKHLAGAPS